MIYIIAIPERLEDSVAEAEYQHVLHRLLAEIVVNAVNLRFVKNAENLCVQILARGGAVTVPERAFR